MAKIIYQPLTHMRHSISVSHKNFMGDLILGAILQYVLSALAGRQRVIFHQGVNVGAISSGNGQHYTS